ncbi:MAG: hypothetical protein ACLTA7_02435 [Ruminococcus sp.]
MKKEEKQKRRSEQPTKEERFQAIMERLIHDIELKERKEGRYRRLDEAIRRHQQSRKWSPPRRKIAKKNNVTVKEQTVTKNIKKELYTVLCTAPFPRGNNYI